MVLLKDKMKFKSIILCDLYRYCGSVSTKKFLWAFFRIPGFRYMFFVRKLKSYPKFHPFKYFYMIFYVYYSYKYGFQIPYMTNIGEGFYIGHFGTIVINRNAKFGRNCNVAHNVTVGQTNKGIHKGVPTFGDNVWIGTGSVIVGGIEVGNNVLIGPNSYVNFNVPSNSLVLGNPGKIINKPGIVDGYINNRV